MNDTKESKMNGKHTPGPWRAFRGEQKRAQREVQHAQGWTIAKVLRAGSDAEADANLRLIAAAPEMLDALRELARVATIIVEHDEYLHPAEIGELWRRAKEARALLARVDRGES